MTWVAVLSAGLIAYALKGVGYLLPARWSDGDLIRRSSALLPAALLAALVVVEGFSNGRQLTVDARAVGLVVAAMALRFRTPFIAVVVLAAAAAAVARALGMP